MTNDTARIAREYIATLEGKVAKLERDLKRSGIARRSLLKMFENARDDNRRILTAVERHRENIDLARQADGEHGAHWLNEGAVREWRADNRYLSEALNLFMLDETLEGE